MPATHVLRAWDDEHVAQGYGDEWERWVMSLPMELRASRFFREAYELHQGWPMNTETSGSIARYVQDRERGRVVARRG